MIEPVFSGKEVGKANGEEELRCALKKGNLDSPRVKRVAMKKGKENIWCHR